MISGPREVHNSCSEKLSISKGDFGRIGVKKLHVEYRLVGNHNTFKDGDVCKVLLLPKPSMF